MPRLERLRHYPLVELTRARLLEFVRDPSAVFWVFGFPVILAVVLGIAFRNTGPETPRAAVTGPAAAALLSRVKSAEGVALDAMEEQAAARALGSGRVDLVVRAAEGPGGKPELTYRFDPTRPGAVAAELAVDRVLQRAFGRTDAIAIRTEHAKERGGRYIDFLLPGLIGLNVMGSCMWGMGYSIVDARKRKLLKRFAVTPMNRAHFQLSFILSRLVFLAAEIAVLVGFGALAFDVRVQGPILALVAAALFGTAAFSGLALLIASRTDSTEVASGWMNFVQMPMWLFSGSFFTYSHFPAAIHPFIKALPLTAFNDAARLVTNEGASFAAILPQLGILAAWAVLSSVLAMKMFRWS